MWLLDNYPSLFLLPSTRSFPPLLKLPFFRQVTPATSPDEPPLPSSSLLCLSLEPNIFFSLSLSLINSHILSPHVGHGHSIWSSTLDLHPLTRTEVMGSKVAKEDGRSFARRGMAPLAVVEVHGQAAACRHRPAVFGHRGWNILVP